MDDSLTIDFIASGARSRASSPDRTRSSHRHTLSSSNIQSSLHDLGRSLGRHTPQSHRRTKSASPEVSVGSMVTEEIEHENANGGGGLQERLLTKVLQQMLPSDYSLEKYAEMKDKRKDKDRPPFSLTLMSHNFRRFNASFITRHPPPPTGMPMEKYTAHGPAIAPPPEIKAVSEMSKDFFRNLRDLQNVMDDFSVIHDKIIAIIGPPTNFSDETLSSALFLLLFIISCALFISASVLPWRLIFLISGWIAVSLGHPTLQQLLIETHNTHLQPKEAEASVLADTFIHKDIILDATPESREVEIFELQRLTSSGGEYESWMFSPNPYEPLSPARISHERPKGTRFFEDVRCPPGWDWLDRKWTLHLGSTVWVAERYISGVEIEEEGERWVYDRIGGEQGNRGEWRRRRWIRRVQRKYQMRPGEI
ncbi:Peroxisome size and maintenance regulator [Rhizina undulata]